MNQQSVSKSERRAKNLYNCHQCGNAIITEDIDEGVTPASLSCAMFGGCKDGRMWSFGYNVPPSLVASHEWFNDGKGEALNIRKITEVRKSFSELKPEIKEILHPENKISSGGIQSGRTKYHEKFQKSKRNGKK